MTPETDVEWDAGEVAALLGAGVVDVALQRATARCAACPEDAAAWFLLASARHRDGDLAAAMAAFERTLALCPRDVRAHAALGALRGAQGDHAGALALFESGLDVAPADPRLHVNAAVALEALGRDDAALAHYEQALAAFPGFGDALQNRAALHLRRGRVAAAAADAARLASLFPGLPEPFVLLADCRLATGDWQGALNAYETALSHAPEHRGARRGRAAALAARGEPCAASDTGAVPIEPRTLFLHAAWERHRRADWSTHAAFVERLSAAIGSGDTVPASVAEPGLAWAAHHLPLTPAARTRLSAAVATRLRAPCAQVDRHHPAAKGRTSARLRLGYLGHETTLAPLLAAHDRARFELHGFALGAGDVPTMRPGVYDVVHDLATLEDAEAAACVGAAGIDILVDTRGYLPHARPGILAARAAPLQIGYGTYPGGLGRELLDYRVSDALASPPQAPREFTEAVLRLPHAPLIVARAPAPSPTATRANWGLPGGAPVAACHHAPAQLEPTVFAAWMRILADVPTAVLWLREGAPGVAGRLRQAAAAAGVAPARLVFAPPGRRAPLALADLVLDTWLVAGQYTVAAALAAAVPVIALRGETFAARRGASLVAAAGLSECIVTNPDDYVERACTLLMNERARTDLRRRLTRQEAPLFDPAARARDYERGLLAAWARHCAGQAPADLELAASP